jgi:hypothetical protein
MIPWATVSISELDLGLDRFLMNPIPQRDIIE